MLSEPGATNQAHLLIPQDLSRSLDLLKSLPVAESTEKDRLEPVLDVLAAWNGDGGRIDLVVDWMEWLDKTLQECSDDHWARSRMVRRLRRLCDLAEDLPKSMELQDIPVCKSTFRPVLTSRSSVYQGELQDRLVAIKSPRWGEEEKRQHHKKLRVQAVFWRNIKHTNIVPFVGVAVLRRLGPSLITEWMVQGTILPYAHSHPSTLDHLKLIKDIAMGLQYLHVEIKMIHGDLKDTNVLIAQDGTARLTDFDVALFIINTTQNQELNVGTTHAYSAIEICIGTNWDDDAFKPTEPTDMWAFGVLMFEIWTLTRSFTYYLTRPGIVPADLPAFIADENRPCQDLSVFANLPDALKSFIWQCWEPVPATRPVINDIFHVLAVTEANLRVDVE